MLRENPRMVTFLFYFSMSLIILWVYQRIEDPLAFAFIGGGIALFSFILRRAIRQLTTGSASHE